MEQTETPSLPRFPPLPKILDYPVTTGIIIVVFAAVLLLFASKRFDRSEGPFTIALLVVLSFIGMSVYSMLFTVPQDEETATIIGGMVAAFGAVVAFWLKNRNGGHGPPPPPPD